jgi:hypothetical protein
VKKKRPSGYTLEQRTAQIFAARYQLYLPTEEELRRELERERVEAMLELERRDKA